MSILVVRRFRYGDEQAVKQLVTAAHMELLSKLFVATYFKETTLQFLIILTAVIFIFCGVSIKLCWLTFPTLAVLVYICLYIGLVRDVRENIDDLENIDQFYEMNPRTGLWVAQIVPEKSVSSPQDLNPHSETVVRNRNFGDSSSEIIGVCAIQIKEDLNKQEPPDSVGLVTRFAVQKKFRRKGVGQELFSVLWSHSLLNFRAVEVVTSEHEIPARNFLERQEFSILNQEDRSPFPAIFNFNQYRFRRACVSSITEDDLTETVIQN